MSLAERRFTARMRPHRHRVVITLTAAVLAAGALVANPAIAGAAGVPCTVTNPATTATYSSLQDAVNAAAGGAQLLVYGTCTGTTTIGTNLTITGQGNALDRDPTLNGGGQGSVLTIESGTTVTLNTLTITGGNATLVTADLGGGIRNIGGTVTINNSTVSRNTAGNGGGILNDAGTMTLTDSIVSGNTGDGIYNRAEKIGPSPTLTLNGTTSVSDNTNPGVDGGGILNEGTLTLTGTVIVSRNSSAYGGGIWNGYDATVNFVFRATVSDNTATVAGGGIRNYGTLNSAYAGINVFGNTPDDID
jgi:hypothetical protein